MVHRFEALGQYIAVDVGSGAVHMLSKTAYDVLGVVLEHKLSMTAQCDQNVLESLGSSSDIHEAWGELHELCATGQLFAPDTAATLTLPTETPLKALCLHVAHDCNLRCGYCFANTGDFGAQRGIIEAETACRAIDLLVKRSEKRRNLEVDFFGGEPLMALDAVKKTVAYARSLEQKHGKTFRFTLTTNGVLLDDDTIAFLNREMSNVVLSLDGRPEVNDMLRRTVNDKGSYDLIVPRYQKLVAARTGDYYVRGTFTAQNLDFSEDVLHLASLGFRNISIEPVVLPDDHPLALKLEHLPQIEREYETLARLLQERKHIHFFHFGVDLNQGPCVYKRLRGCGAGFEYAAVTPDGSLYPCHQFAERPEYRMGDLFTDTFDAEISRKFNHVHVNVREGCADCWAKYYCSGGCAAANLNTMGHLDTPYPLGCAMEKKRLELAIAMQAAAAE